MNTTVTFASIGDTCIDNYPALHQSYCGGTAFNIAYRSAALGAKTTLFSSVGTDASGKQLYALLQNLPILLTHLRILPGKTSCVDVVLDNNGSPIYSGWELGVLKEYALSPNDISTIQKHQIARAVLFKPMAHLFDQFISASFPHTMKVADFAGSSQYSEGISVVERYIDSLDIVIKSLDSSEPKEIQYLRVLSTKYPQKLILVLLGSEGSIVFKNGKTYHQSAIKVDVVDANGAGDAYVSHFLIHYYRTKNIQEAMIQASLTAKETIIHFGAVPNASFTT